MLRERLCWANPVRRTAWLAAFLVLVVSSSRAAIIYTVSAELVDATLDGFTPDGSLAITADSRKSHIDLAKIHRICVNEIPPVRNAAATVDVYTATGSRISGKLAPPARALAVLSAAVGKTPIDMDAGDLLGVHFLGAKGEGLAGDRFSAELARPDRDSDTLFVMSDKGVVPFSVAVTKIAPDAVAFHWRGEDRTIETRKVAAIIFANSAQRNPQPATVALSDTTVLCGSIVSLNHSAVEIDVAGTKALIPMASVLSIELANPNVAYLSALQPTSIKEVPFFNHIWKHRLDRNVAGNPLTLDGKEYARGIGCHTQTELTYDLGGRYNKFAAVIGIDDQARPRGSVQFIVLVDGKQVFSQTLTGRDRAMPIALDISGANRLTLIAGFAEDASIGDHADWADARVMR